MRYLILGDIHGNLPALELVLAKEKNGYDQLVCHGDVVNYGPWSNECVAILEQMDNKILLKGNHEEYFIKGAYDGTHPVAKAFFEFNIQKFTCRQQISAYGDTYRIEDYSVQHTFDNKYIFKDTEICPGKNYIIGHSHQQFRRLVNGYDIINTGSVGQNREYIDVINYIVWDTKEPIQFKSMIYDADVIINEFKVRQYPAICIDYYANKKRYLKL